MKCVNRKTGNSVGQKVLLLAPTFYFLYKQIVRELEKQGFEVTFIPDELQKYNPLFSTSSMPGLKKIYYDVYKPNLRYLRQYLDKIECEYDYFLCINGYSFHPFLMERIRAVNPKIKSILYLWDGLAFFDFSYQFQFFDSVYSFDFKDSEAIGVKCLPLYWVGGCEVTEPNKCQYDISFIGTLHSDRFRFIDEVVSQCTSLGLAYYIKLVYRQRSLTIFDHLKYAYYKRVNDFNAKGFVDEYNILRGEINSDFLSNISFSGNIVENVIQKSRCVLDIELPYQTGITNRMINSMAKKKKIVTTNQMIKNTIFWDANNICCIDRNIPYLEENFVCSDYVENPELMNYLTSLRIDNWVKTLLYD